MSRLPQERLNLSRKELRAGACAGMPDGLSRPSRRAKTVANSVGRGAPAGQPSGLRESGAAGMVLHAARPSGRAPATARAARHHHTRKEKRVAVLARIGDFTECVDQVGGPGNGSSIGLFEKLSNPALGG